MEELENMFCVVVHTFDVKLGSLADGSRSGSKLYKAVRENPNHCFH